MPTAFSHASRSAGPARSSWMPSASGQIVDMSRTGADSSGRTQERMGGVVGISLGYHGKMSLHPLEEDATTANGTFRCHPLESDGWKKKLMTAITCSNAAAAGTFALGGELP